MIECRQIRVAEPWLDFGLDVISDSEKEEDL
jgi:hypothetical protein